MGPSGSRINALKDLKMLIFFQEAGIIAIQLYQLVAPFKHKVLPVLGYFGKLPLGAHWHILLETSFSRNDQLGRGP